MFSYKKQLSPQFVGDFGSLMPYLLSWRAGTKVGSGKTLTRQRRTTTSIFTFNFNLHLTRFYSYSHTVAFTTVLQHQNDNLSLGCFGKSPVNVNEHYVPIPSMHRNSAAAWSCCFRSCIKMLKT